MGYNQKGTTLEPLGTESSFGFKFVSLLLCSGIPPRDPGLIWGLHTELHRTSMIQTTLLSDIKEYSVP